MRFEVFMAPLALAAAAPVSAENYLTVEQAQALIFPKATLVSRDFTLSPDQIDTLERVSGSTVWHSKVKVWQASPGGWLFLDQVPGREDRITYMVGLDESGALKKVEILVCRDGYCGLRDPEWLQQFYGKRASAAPGPYENVHLISGSTLSTEHVAEGIKRVLMTYAMFLAPTGR